MINIGRRKDKLTQSLPGFEEDSVLTTGKYIAPEFGGADFGKPKIPSQPSPAKIGQQTRFLQQRITKPELRPYQERARKALLWAISASNPERANAVACLIFCGLGKTTIGCSIADEVAIKFKRKVLIVCPQEELIEQWIEGLERFGIIAMREQGKWDAFTEFATAEHVVVVASQQSLVGERLEKWPRDFFDLIMHDECDLALAPTWKYLFEHFVTARHIGFTATPKRLDGGTITKLFPVIPAGAVYTLKDGVRDGWAVRPVVKRAKHESIDLSKLRVTMGDFDKQGLDEVISQQLSSLVEAVIPVIEDKPTIAYFPTVLTAIAAAEVFNQFGITARAIDGKTKTRKQDFDDFKAREYQVLCNCNLVNRGVDLPLAEVAVMCRPTASETLYQQMVGRIMRKYEDPVSGYVKTKAIIVDFQWKFEKKKHTLATPLDLWDTKDTDVAVMKRAIEIASKIADEYPEMDLDGEELIERAKRDIREEVKGRVKAMVNGVRAQMTTLDPLLLDIMEIPERPATKWMSKLPATKAQIEYLQTAFKVRTDQIPDLSMQKASRMIEELKQRKSENLASWPQVQALIRNNVDLDEARAMTIREASDKIDELFESRKRK